MTIQDAAEPVPASLILQVIVGADSGGMAKKCVFQRLPCKIEIHWRKIWMDSLMTPPAPYLIWMNSNKTLSHEKKYIDICTSYGDFCSWCIACGLDDT